jgi:hypothetical protein
MKKLADYRNATRQHIADLQRDLGAAREREAEARLQSFGEAA